MKRREFTKAMGAVAAGLVAGSRVVSGPRAFAADEKAPKHVCKGHNSCKGQGGCSSGDGGCAGKNSCKGKGGCQVPVKEHKDTKNP
jgi:hypothetical protein